MKTAGSVAVQGAEGDRGTEAVKYLDYRVEWNGDEYVARASGIDDVSGHSRIALFAMQALVRKLRELGTVDQDGVLTKRAYRKGSDD